MLGSPSGEWCSDEYSPTYYSESPSLNPTGPRGSDGAREDVLRVIRGVTVHGFAVKPEAATARGGR